MSELKDLIAQHFLLPMAKIFGKPRDIADALTQHVPEGSNEGDLEDLATRIIESRKAKSWPSVPELIESLKTLRSPKSSLPVSLTKKPKHEQIQWAEAERRAIQFLRVSPLTDRAIREGWGPALLDFCIKNGREPGFDEEGPLIAISRKNDVDARDFPGPLASAVWQWRMSMHRETARRLRGE